MQPNNDLFRGNVRSEHLTDVKKLLESIPGQLSVVKNLIQLDLIVDANVVIADIRWLSSSKRKDGASTFLLEIIESGTVTVYAPTFLIEEMSKHIPRIANKYNLEIDEVEKHWKRFESHIQFKDVPDADEEEIRNAQDYKDLPYLKLQEMIGAHIYSKDTDISAMNGKVIQAALIPKLKDYSREAAIEYTIHLTGVGSMIITEKILLAAKDFISVMWGQFKGLPQWLKLIMAAAVIVAIVHPKSREFLKTILMNMSGAIGEAGSALLSASLTSMQEYQTAQENRVSLSDHIKENLEGRSV